MCDVGRAVDRSVVGVSMDIIQCSVGEIHCDRVVTTDAGRKLADEWKAVFVEASAKHNEVS